TAQRRYDQRSKRCWRTTAVAVFRGLPGDLRQKRTRPNAKPLLLPDPSAGSVHRARVAVSIPAQVPRGGRAALRAILANSAGSDALRAAVSGVHAASAWALTD